MTKLIIYTVLILALIGFIKWAHYTVDMGGYNRHKSEVADIKDAAVAKDKEDIRTIIKWREKEKVVYRDKIKFIDRVKDTTGCADVKYTDMGFGLQ